MLQASLRVFLNVAFSAPALLSDCQPLRKLYSIAPKIKCLWRSFGSSGPRLILKFICRLRRRSQRSASRRAVPTVRIAGQRT